MVVLVLCAKEVTAIEAFVRDLGRKLKAQAELHGASGAITPVELYVFDVDLFDCPFEYECTS